MTSNSHKHKISEALIKISKNVGLFTGLSRGPGAANTNYTSWRYKINFTPPMRGHHKNYSIHGWVKYKILDLSRNCIKINFPDPRIKIF